MKRILYTIISIFIFAGIAVAGVNWIVLDSTSGKTLQIAECFNNNFKTFQITLNKEGTELLTYILKITQNNKSYTCGIVSYCPLNREEGTIALTGVVNGENYSSFKVDKVLKFKKPTGTIKIAHEYVCQKFYDSLIKYDTYMEAAKKFTDEKDFKNALNSYKLAYEEATALANQGYSANRQAETLFLAAELCETYEKPALARGFYQEVANLKNLNETSYKDKAIAKANSIPVTKGEKAKEVAGNVMWGVGAVGVGALKILLNN